MNILFIADIIGSPGRKVIKQFLPGIKEEFAIDLVIANGENSAGGYGITAEVYHELMENGIEVFTMGNHIWQKKEFIQNIQNFPKVIKPANYPPAAPGQNYFLADVKGTTVGIFNLEGRVFMKPLDCPFRASDIVLDEIKGKARIIIVDVHAEATSEKKALGYYLNGRVSAVIGTHTHVQTADDQIFPGGTGFITDAGMVGPYDSVIGMNKEQILTRFLTGMPSKFEVEKEGRGVFNAVVLKVDIESGNCKEIIRVNRITEAKPS
ncbi:MAG: TIGR00282 family metallophosphoesterase [Candidatus Saganbacteria bacterium]|nr:TIGR00282 family metallophosphoesterase [Candidatus Saganbacteria bacterium]